MELNWLASVLASDATDGEGALAMGFRPLHRDQHVVGRATTVTMDGDDSAALRTAIEQGPVVPGATVLVAGGATTARRACLGGYVARRLLLAGFTALITDGLVRDSADVRATGFQVWSRGVCPIAAVQRGGGKVGPSVVIDDVLVHDGDWVIADEDGIVFWPQDRYAELVAAAQKHHAFDQERERPLDQQLKR